MTREEVEARTIYLVRAGSHAYGLNTETSDVDTRGICIPTEEAIYGLGKFEQYEDKVNDTVIYDIRKFFSLAMKCNPNIIELLFVNDEHVLEMSGIGKDLRQHRRLFVSQLARKTFGGYAISQMKKFHRSALQPGAPELNYKNAMHLIRLLRTGISILQTGEPIVNREHDRKELLAIRRGEHSNGSIMDIADELFEKLDLMPSTLQSEPNYEMLNHLLISYIKGYLKGNDG